MAATTVVALAESEIGQSGVSGHAATPSGTGPRILLAAKEQELSRLRQSALEELEHQVARVGSRRILEGCHASPRIKHNRHHVCRFA
jgi:hypothetical protein